MNKVKRNNNLQGKTPKQYIDSIVLFSIGTIGILILTLILTIN